MSQILKKDKTVIAMKLLEDNTGKKMGKTEGNMITFEDSPNDMFGKIMSMPDDLIVKYFIHCTRIPMEKIKKMEADMKAEKVHPHTQGDKGATLGVGVNPRDLKLELASEIVKIYHGEKEAETAKEYFIKTFSKKEIPENIPEVKVDTDSISLLDFIILSGNAASKGDARRKIEQGGVEIDGKKIEDTCGKEVLRRILGGNEITKAEFKGAYYRKALEVKELIKEELESVLKKFDCLILPTVPMRPWDIGQGAKMKPEDIYAADALTIPANLAEICAISLPAGKIEGIPVGMQVMCGKGEERKMLSIAREIEKLGE